MRALLRVSRPWIQWRSTVYAVSTLVCLSLYSCVLSTLALTALSDSLLLSALYILGTSYIGRLTSGLTALSALSM